MNTDFVEVSLDEPTEVDSVEVVEDAIERLNAAIDAVNVLEDEHQACSARHACIMRELHCHVAVLESELRSGSFATLMAAAVEACISVQKAQQHLESAERALLAEQQQQQLNGAQHGSKQRVAAASKAVAAAKKAASTAVSREEKARRTLQRTHAQERQGEELSNTTSTAPQSPSHTL